MMDRFEASLDGEKDRIIRRMTDLVERRFAEVKEDVQRVRARVMAARPGPAPTNNPVPTDEPKVKSVTVEPLRRSSRIKRVNQQEQDQQGTSSGSKRKKVQGPDDTRSKRPVTEPVVGGGPKKHACIYQGCGKSFRKIPHLKRHERIHMNIKPFHCTWPDCDYSAKERGHVIKHVRAVHFNLPVTKKAQHERNIEDDRDPNDYVRVDQDLVNRRLE